jgi:mRNA interferase MazF
MRVDADDLSGLAATSWVMVDKVTTVRRSSVFERIGRLSSAQLVDLERLVMVFLGLAD